MGIDYIFGQEEGFLPLEDRDIINKLVSATADGARANFGVKSGSLTRIKENQAWLLKIHCCNHRTELAVGSVFGQDNRFQEIEDLYKGMFFLHDNSGKIRHEVKMACESLNIAYYKLRKIHGISSTT